MKQRQAIPIERPFTEVRLALEIMFEGIEGSGSLPVTSMDAASSSNRVLSSKAASTSFDTDSVQVGNIVQVTHR